MGRTVKFALASVLVVCAVSALGWGVMSVASLPVVGAASTGSGRPDMVDLLNTMLKLDVASASSLTVKKTPANCDSDGNGIPDNLFDARFTPGAGEVWVGDAEGVAGRRVAIANLSPASSNADASYVEAAVQRGLTVVAPTLDVLRSWASNQPEERAGHLASADGALLIVTVSSALSVMVDGADGQYSAASAESWAGDSLATAPAGLPLAEAAIPYVGLAVVYTYNGGQDVAELNELPADSPLTVRIEGADLSQGLPALFAYPIDADMNASSGPMLSGRMASVWAAIPATDMRADIEAGALETALTTTGLLGAVTAGDLGNGIKATTVKLTMLQVEGLGAVYPPKGTYDVPKDTELAVTATPGNGWKFDRWEGGVKYSKLSSTSVVMSTDKQIKAVFVEKPIVTQYTLSLVVNGSGDTNPTSDETHKYDENEDIEILAEPAPGWRFDHWEGSLNGTENPARLRMDADKSVTAVFAHAEVAIKSVSPNSAWLFGGIISEIRGSNFAAGCTVKIGDQAAVVTSRKTDPTTKDSILTVAVPPLDQSGVEAEYRVAVEVRNPAGTSARSEDDVDVLPNGFTYIRYDVSSDIPTTSFIFSASAQEYNTFVHLIGTQTAKLKLPVVPQTGYATFFGLVRAAKEPEDLHTDLVDSTLDPTGDTDGKIPLVWTFDLHIYGTTGAVPTQTTPGTPIYSELTKSWVYNRQGTPAVLEIPVNDTAILPTDVESGLRTFSIQYDFNYAATKPELQVPVLPNPVEVTYQSTVLKNEMTFSSTPSAMGLQSYDKFAVRLYSLGAISLERGALPMPKKVLDGIKVDTVATGSLSGGSAVRLLSAEGGLAWIDKVVFGEAANGANAVLSTAVGTSEFVFDVLSPPYDKSGAASVSIYLKSNPNEPIKTISNAFTYSPEVTETWATPVLVAVGVVALAIAGIALGKLALTKGPCFIATAAYGTPLAAQIDALRLLRDQYLLNNPLGTAFVDFYYHVSPSVADVIAAHPVLAAITRVALIPVVFYARALVTAPATTLFATLMFVAFVVLRRAAKKTKKARA